MEQPEPPGQSLGGLLKISGASLMVSSVLYVWAFVAEFILPSPGFGSVGALLQYIATYRSFFVLSYALFTFANGLSVVGALGIYAATRERSASFAALGGATLVVGLVSAILTNTTPALIRLSDGYASAFSPADQQAYATAALALSANNNMLVPSSFIGVGVLFLSLAMTKGSFERPLAYLGLVVGTLNIVRYLPYIADYPLLTGAVFVAISSVWIFGVGRRIYKSG